MNEKTFKAQSEGWTFIETLIVMSIVMILSVSVGFSSVKQIDKAKRVSAKSQIESFALALEAYYMDVGSYPSMEEGLEALRKSDDESWMGPYIAKPVPEDPWGNEYVYSVPGKEGLPFEVLSFGKDGVEGGAGNDQDISSSE